MCDHDRTSLKYSPDASGSSSKLPTRGGTVQLSPPDKGHPVMPKPLRFALLTAAADKRWWEFKAVGKGKRGERAVGEDSLLGGLPLPPKSATFWRTRLLRIGARG
jgi:hypothetical protein